MPLPISEAVQVVAEAPVPIDSPVVGMNFKQPEIELLATPRTLQGIAQLSPAVTENSPNTNQVVINGAFAFDSMFLVNGVDINDNVLAQPQSLFVEDAIEETQVLTSGVSAEYGRFSGGVINAITKSGGNQFSGTGRINFQNPSWTAETPFEASRPVPIVHADDLQAGYEGTLGGPLIRDRLWFFMSGRYAALGNPRTLSDRRPGGAERQEQARRNQADGHRHARSHHSGRLSEQPSHGHEQLGRVRPGRRSQRAQHDQHAEPLVPRQLPRRLRSDMLFEAQLSGRYNELIGGGTGSNIATNSPFVGTCFCTIYNAPYFDGARRRAAQQPAVHGQRHEFLEGRRQPRDEGRLRVVPQPADRRRLAVADPVRLRRQFPDWTPAAQPVLDDDGTADSGVQPGRFAARRTFRR